MKGARMLLAAIVLAGCEPSTDAVTLGAAGPWKEGYGMMNRRGIELAVEEINARGGILGRTLRVEMRDDDGDGARATAIAQAFVDDPAVIAVVGHVNSGAMVAAAKIYDGSLPAVATTATSPDLSGASPWVFRVISSDSANGIDLARFANRMGLRRAAILYENNAYGRGLADAFRRSFRGEIVSLDPVPDDETNFEPFIAFYHEREPDLVFVAGTEASGIQVLREARRQRLNAAFLGGDGWTGVVADRVASDGALIGTPFAASDPRPEAQRFVTAYQRKFGAEPDANAALAYDATMLLATAIAERGADRAKVREHLASLTVRKPFRGVTGEIAFNKAGDPVGKSFVMTRVRSGGLVVEDGR